ncbi:hypothetical protein HELRODRAFT_194459 [Helobdella robusta]|uniref:BHLH domain-containing protein n=1 Tax=Helobdella robusta TaxID=6412 RepID=T1FW28_HELRO|nr:hypothetical protein HELRODRAFT_194459 [Helobdella robusta]ESN91969.1 hypothetical protein HELRODRAFT_194459 [Helobdella robusta]
MKRDSTGTAIIDVKKDVPNSHNTLYSLSPSVQILSENLTSVSGYQVVEVQNGDEIQDLGTADGLAYIPITTHDIKNENNINENSDDNGPLYFLLPNGTAVLNSNILSPVATTAAAPPTVSLQPQTPPQQRATTSLLATNNIASTSSSSSTRVIKFIRPSIEQQPERVPIMIVPKDSKRKATHNEVERRRRDKITTWIVQLGSMLPASLSEKQNDSKGDILSKVCEFIQELQAKNQQLKESMEHLIFIKQALEETSHAYAEALMENSSIKSKFSELGFSCEVRVVNENMLICPEDGDNDVISADNNNNNDDTNYHNHNVNDSNYSSHNDINYNDHNNVEVDDVNETANDSNNNYINVLVQTANNVENAM